MFQPGASGASAISVNLNSLPPSGNQLTATGASDFPPFLSSAPSARPSPPLPLFPSRPSRPSCSHVRAFLTFAPTRINISPAHFERRPNLCSQPPKVIILSAPDTLIYPATGRYELTYAIHPVDFGVFLASSAPELLLLPVVLPALLLLLLFWALLTLDDGSFAASAEQTNGSLESGRRQTQQ